MMPSGEDILYMFLIIGTAVLGAFGIVWLVDNLSDETAIISNYRTQVNVLKSNAIENGCAQYNPKTGDFEWVSDKPMP